MGVVEQIDCGIDCCLLWLPRAVANGFLELPVVVDLVDWSKEPANRCSTLDRNRRNGRDNCIVDNYRNHDSNDYCIVDGRRDSSAIRRGTCSRDFVVVVCSVVDCTIDAIDSIGIDTTIDQ